MAVPVNPVERRVFFGLLGVGLAGTLAGCSPSTAPGQAVPPGGAGPPRVLRRAPVATRQIALTVDDGYNDDVVAGYAAFAVRTGIHLTFSPNGLYAHAWAPQARRLKPLIERGQVQMINHTFHHRDLRTLSDAHIRMELERNNEWVSKVFATDTRPYYRPPFGFHNARIDATAAELGYRNTVLWSGSWGDSHQITPATLLGLARQYLKPGVIMLGHANHPTVLGLFDQIIELIKQRDLDPVTLNEMFASPPTS